MPSTPPTALQCLEEEFRSGLRSPNNARAVFPQAAASDAKQSITEIERDHNISLEGSFSVVHYTSVAALLSMLKHAGRNAGKGQELAGDEGGREVGYLRMYSSARFNDPGEGLYLARTARLIPRQTDAKEENDSFCDLVWGAIASDAAETGPRESRYAYVASFIRPKDTEDIHDASDNLAFWRSYGQDGRGCSLTMPVSECMRKGLRAVKYGRKDANDTIQRLRRIFTPMMEFARELDTDVDDVTKILHSVIVRSMERLNYLYKSEAYKYERECRVVETPTTIRENEIRPVFESSEQPGCENVRRYINHPALSTYQRDGIFMSGSRITLGPRVSNRGDVKEYLERLLKNANLLGTQVFYSKIEYRHVGNC